MSALEFGENMLFSSDLCCNDLRCSLVIVLNKFVYLEKNILTFFFFLMACLL